MFNCELKLDVRWRECERAGTQAIIASRKTELAFPPFVGLHIDHGVKDVGGIGVSLVVYHLLTNSFSLYTGTVTIAPADGVEDVAEALRKGGWTAHVVK